MLDSANIWVSSSLELLRAIRGKRSQVAFSRRLGYHSNVVAAWEGGHRSPTASTLLRAMERVGIDVREGFQSFHAGSAAAIDEGLPAWLQEIRGHASQVQIAENAHCSRHQVRRWLSGEAAPRVPQFLGLVHAMTGRAPDWVAAFVDISLIPTLHGRYQAARTASRLAYDHPWSAAVLMLIDSAAYRSNPTDAFLSRSLDVADDALDAAIDALLAAGLAERSGGQLRPLSTFTADAKASREDRRRLKAHWSRFAADRLHGSPRPDDLVSLNLAILSRADLERVHQLQRDYFRALRSLVAASEPEEAAALVLMQVLSLTPADAAQE